MKSRIISNYKGKVLVSSSEKEDANTLTSNQMLLYSSNKEQIVPQSIIINEGNVIKEYSVTEKKSNNTKPTKQKISRPTFPIISQVKGEPVIPVLLHSRYRTVKKNVKYPNIDDTYWCITNKYNRDIYYHLFLLPSSTFTSIGEDVRLKGININGRKIPIDRINKYRTPYGNNFALFDNAGNQIDDFPKYIYIVNTKTYYTKIIDDSVTPYYGKGIITNVYSHQDGCLIKPLGVKERKNHVKCYRLDISTNIDSDDSDDLEDFKKYFFLIIYQEVIIYWILIIQMYLIQTYRIMFLLGRT